MNAKLIILVARLVLGRGHYIQKCCDLHQQLNANFDGCADFDVNKGAERYDVVEQAAVDPDGVNFVKLGRKNQHHIWWLPPELQFLSTNSSTGTAFQPANVSQVANIRFLYNRKNPCPEFSRMLLPFNDYVFMLDNGSLLVTGIADNVRPETMIFPSSAYCLDRVSLTERKRRRRSGRLLDHSYAIFVCPCLVYTCVRMCCHKRCFLNAHDDVERCTYAPEIPATWSLNYLDYDGKSVDRSKSFAITEGVPTCDNYYYLNDNSSIHTKNFWILPDGSVRVENRSTDVGVSDYCIHFLNIRGRYKSNLRLCPETFNQNPSVEAYVENIFNMPTSEVRMVDFRDLLYKIYFVTGAIFLALALLICIFVSKLRKSVFDKILCAHVASLFVCYSTMAFEKIFKPVSPMWWCKLTGYIIQYSFIASTLWLNAMCLCIFNSFRGYNCVNQTMEQLKCTNKYLIYSIYVWGGAAIVSFVTFLADNIIILGLVCRPQFGVHSCWLRNGLPQLIYFYLPIAVILSSNLYLFISTLKKIISQQKKSSILRNQESKKHIGNNEVSSKPFSFTLYVRLFSLMGITWIFEILSWIIGGPDYYWYVPDAVNALRGVFVFIICCCKKEIFFLILKRPSKASTSPADSTSRTRSSSVQMVFLKNSTEISAEESA